MNKVRRIYIEKKPEYAVESELLLNELKDFLGIEKLSGIRIVHRIDVEGMDDETYKNAKPIVFFDPVVDCIYEEEIKINKEDKYFIVEFLPGQYNQKADFAMQCLKIMSADEDIIVRTADVIILEGKISNNDFDKIKNYYINPVETREAAVEKPHTLKEEIAVPDKVEILEGFIDDKDGEEYLDSLGLAMTLEDLKFTIDYFKNVEKRNPTITEIRVIDTYWSDHCRHTTFNTIIDKVKIEEGKYKSIIEKALEKYKEVRGFVYGERQKEICLMDLAQITAKEMRKKGDLPDLEESDEINAASIEVEAKIDGKEEKWLVMFKNETHNHPTEIEPFGGAATCLGGAIRDPLSGRSYVYGAIRITGSGDPRTPADETLPGKLPQRKITTTAALGYSSYGSQIGIPAGQVEEIYHDGFVAKRMELGAVIAAAPKENVVREKPVPGDAVILVGGKTGRDGCGGATGSSKEHDEESAVKSGAEVQKGNASIEGYIQKLFRNPQVSKMIKKCNDFGAGGVSVAVGELADGLLINLDAVPVKYEGLDGTELAISESQERMAVIVGTADKDRFIKYANEENLEATIIALVTDEKRLTMIWKGNTIVDIKRDFLDSNGVRQHTSVIVDAINEEKAYFDLSMTDEPDIKNKWLENLKRLNICSQKGLVQKFDFSAGANTILAPFGGKYQDTPTEGLLMKLPVLKGETVTSTAMTYGYNPYLFEWSPFHGGIYSVIMAVSKIVAMGGDYRKIRLSMQEYFEKLGDDQCKWGKPFAALLGAFAVQDSLSLPAIGGKDSMSGTFMDIHVPPTLVTFALNVMDVRNAISPEFKVPGNRVVLLPIKKDENHMPDFTYLKKLYEKVYRLIKSGKVLSASTIKEGGLSAEISKMCFGNRIGIRLNDDTDFAKLFIPNLGSFIIELDKKAAIEDLSDIEYALIGETTEEEKIIMDGLCISLKDAYSAWTDALKDVFPATANAYGCDANCDSSKFINGVVEYKKRNTARPKIGITKPKVLIPVFLGTNSEYEVAKAFEKAGAIAETLVVKNLSRKDFEESKKILLEKISQSQIIALTGGFSGGNEPYGATNFITAVIKTGEVTESIKNFLTNKDGLILGIGNGFQALLKLGLLPYGCIKDADGNGAALTINNNGRNISAMITTKITSTLSPWFANFELGDTHVLPVSHKEGRFVAGDDLINELEENGQIAAQYLYNNPNGSYKAIEAITSPDGRVLGKMGHSERKGDFVGINISGNKDQNIFAAGVEYFKI